jgi:hypothetical protein
MLDLFLGRNGVPEALFSDQAQSYTGGKFQKKVNQAGIFCKHKDLYSPWQNSAESELCEVKQLASRWIVPTKIPQRLFYHAIKFVSIV